MLPVLLSVICWDNGYNNGYRFAVYILYHAYDITGSIHVTFDGGLVKNKEDEGGFMVIFFLKTI